MTQRRVFLGSLVRSPALTELFTDLQQKFATAGDFKWTRTVDNLHLTWHFFGAMPEKQIHELQKVLTPFLSEEIPIMLEIEGVAYFQKKGKPTILYAKLRPNKALVAYYKKLQTVLFSHGFISEIKPEFVPHITLARIKKVKPEFYNCIATYRHLPETIIIHHLKLSIIESVLERQGALYQALVIDK